MIILKNGTFINWETLEFQKTDILVEEGSNGKLRFSWLPGDERNATIIDCSGKFITKSFANGHHHVYSALARGMPAPEKSPVNFLEILQYIWWNLDKALDPAIIRASALATAIACAKNGVTFVIDHHASPFAVEESLETIAQAFDTVGIGHLLCYEISDRDGKEIALKGLTETAQYLQNRQGLVGLHASFTVGDQTLRHAVDLAEKMNTGIHIHVAEDQADQEHCLATYRKRVVERLFDSGALQFPQTILGHGLHLSEREREIISLSDVWVVENMESNLNNAVGFFNANGLGKNIMFGTDGMHSDMLQSAKSAFFAGHQHDSIDYAETYRRFRNVHNYLRAENFSGDGENNLVVLDYDTPTPFESANFLGHFLFGLSARHVKHVISRGKLIVSDGRLLTVDEEKVLAETKIQAARLWKRL